MADLFLLALLASMPTQGRPPAKMRPALRGERRAAIGGSLANSPKTMQSLNDGSDRVEEHIVPDDGYRMASPTRGSLHQEVIKIR